MSKLSDYPAIVLANRKASETLYVMELRVPELAPLIRPGQFVHMEIPTLDSHILRRPFSVYETDVESGTIEILYQVVGTGTADMANWQPGYLTNLIGPIGSEWSPPASAKRALLVGGGVGAAPLFMLYTQLVDDGVEVDVILGAATAQSLVCREKYLDVCGTEPACSTDDGSFGREGFATLPAKDALENARAEDRQYDYVAVCGPEPLMKAVSELAAEYGVPAQVSMERRMACGIGACLSCVIDTVDGKKRACVDGPIFDAEKILF